MKTLINHEKGLVWLNVYLMDSKQYYFDPSTANGKGYHAYFARYARLYVCLTVFI